MKKTYCTYLFFFILVVKTYSQNTVIGRVRPSDHSIITVKWYSPKIINIEGFNVYRKESTSGNWEKINRSPILFKSYKITDEEFKKDKELKNYLDLTTDPDNIKDLALLAVLIKSFKSEAFTKYLGICYDDASVEKNKFYEYKVTSLSKGSEIELGLSEKLFSENYEPILAPKNIQFKTGNRKVSFTWDPEPNRYFGANIYKRANDTGQFYKITKDPVILSKTKNPQGAEDYGSEFFVDTKLKANTKYEYYLEAIDFFGEASQRSKSLIVSLKDLDPPKAPDSVFSKVDGKRVVLKWKKKIKEEDLAGFNIYRTVKNDTDFVKMNENLLSVKDTSYTDQLFEFHSYMYAVSCVDRDSNESVSNPCHVEVYDNEAPAKPQKLIIEPDSGKLTLKWAKNKEQDLKGYLIYRTINKNTEDNYVKITPTAIKENYYVDVLAKNIKNKFLYKIVALDESLNRSPYSDFAIARMPDVSPPNPPFLKSISLNEKRQIYIEWLANAEPDLAGYSIYRKNKNDSSAGVKKLNEKLLDSKVSRYTDRYIEEGVIYEYYLDAVDSSLNVSNPSNHLIYKMRSQNPENELQISSFEVRYNNKRQRVELSWKLKTSVSLKGSVVYKLKAGETNFSPISGALEDVKLSDPDVMKEQSYTYQVRVYDVRGDVYKSEKITLTIK
jgi:uncharacterized protein